MCHFVNKIEVEVENIRDGKRSCRGGAEHYHA